MKGYFAIGVEGLSKPMNAGNLFRSAHAFGASFLFTIGAVYQHKKAASDTSQAPTKVPLYAYDTVDDFTLPAGCRLVGVELLEDAVDLPAFKHPPQAAYVLGPERGSLSPALQARCDHVIKIPTAFCINVATAGAVVMYDRVKSLGRFPRRGTSTLAPVEAPAAHVHGGVKQRRK